MKRSLVLLSCLLFPLIAAQAQSLPKPGALAPQLTYTQLLQASEATKADWRALHGKVVVLEFWATWCAPCIAEIPVLNRLADSIDSRKVQFIAVDDEDPAVVQAFLKKKPIHGWVMLDTSGAVYRRFGVLARPATIVIDTQGRVVSTSVRPERLRRDGLLQLAKGKPAVIEAKADPKSDAAMQAAIAQAMDAQTGKKDSAVDPLFELSVTPGDATQPTHIFLRGVGQLDVMNATPDTLLVYGLRVPASRVKVNGELAKTAYSLHLHAPSTNAAQLADAIEIAIQSACGLKIERRTAIQDVYLLQALDKTKPLNLSSSDPGGFGFYDKKAHQMQLLNASMDQVAEALEQSLDTPVVNESNILGKLVASFPLPSRDFAGVKSALEKNTGLTLIPARRPIEIITVAPKPDPYSSDSSQ